MSLRDNCWNNSYFSDKTSIGYNKKKIYYKFLFDINKSCVSNLENRVYWSEEGDHLATPTPCRCVLNHIRLVLFGAMFYDASSFYDQNNKYHKRQITLYRIWRTCSSQNGLTATSFLYKYFVTYLKVFWENEENKEISINRCLQF